MMFTIVSRYWGGLLLSQTSKPVYLLFLPQEFYTLDHLYSKQAIQ